MMAVRHLGFVGRKIGPHTNCTQCFLSLCKIWLKSIQYNNDRLMAFDPGQPG